MRDVLAAHARGETYMPLRSVMRPPEAAGLMGLMPAWSPARTFSLKVVCVMPGNPARGLDAHQGVVALFDGETGVPEAILDASALTEIRTAAVTAVATDVLARADARVLAILGAGVQARAHLTALAHVRPFTEIRAYARRRARSNGATACATAEEAVRGADVVVAATSSRTPVIDDEWLDPGVHLNAIGASTPAAHEIEPATFARATVFADSRESVAAEAGEYQRAREQGLPAEVAAELGEVLAGTHPGRTDDAELTLFRSLGIAVEDLAAARVAVAAARERGHRGRRCDPAGRDRGGARADQGHRRAHAADPLAARGRARGDLPEARDAPADRVVQDPRRAERDPERARRGASGRPRHRQRRQHGPGRGLGGAGARVCRRGSSCRRARRRPSSARSSGLAAR